MNDTITEEDLRSGLWGNASVQVFWICPYHPEWGIAPLRGGRLGEITIKNGQWTAQLRALFQQMQLPYGYTYTLNCTRSSATPAARSSSPRRSGPRTRPTPMAS